MTQTDLKDCRIAVKVLHEVKKIVDSVESLHGAVGHQLSAVDVVAHWNLGKGGGRAPVLLCTTPS